MFIASDTRSDKMYALKKMMAQSQQVIKQIHNEVKYWKQVNGHQNIVKFLAVQQDTSSNCIYILSELCQNGTLLDLLERYNGKLSEAQIVHILIDVCNGLKHMHDKGIAHRDVKVENILLEQKSFKLCDFGSASNQVLDPQSPACSGRYLDDMIEEFEKYTTMMYRPPEMIDRYLKYKVDTQADVWMMGCVAYSLCFFVHPFQDVQKIGILNA